MWLRDKLQPVKKFEDFNQTVLDITGDMDDVQARVTLAKFLRHNLGFTFQLMTGIEILPIQELILKALFLRDNGIIVAGRGLGKSFLISIFALLYPIFYPNSKLCLISANFRGSRRILEYCEKIINSPRAELLKQCFPKDMRKAQDMYRYQLSNGSEVFALPLSCITGDSLVTYYNGIHRVNEDPTPKNEKFSSLSSDIIWTPTGFNKIDYKYNNGVAPTIKITSKKGFSLETTHNHKIRTIENGDLIFKQSADLKVGDYIVIDRTERWFTPRYTHNPDQAYFLGLMLGDGCFTRPWSLHYTDKHGELIGKIKDITGYTWKTYDHIHYEHFNIANKRAFLDYWMVNPVKARFKTIPKTILCGDKESAAMCLRGLFDSDGSVQVSAAKGGCAITVRFTNTSLNLIKQVQYILLHFGIISCLHTAPPPPIDKIKWHQKYDILICGKNVSQFRDKIGFGLTYKKELLDNGLHQQTTPNSFENVPGAQDLMLQIYDSIYIPYGKRNYQLCLSKIQQRESITFSFCQRFLDYTRPFAEESSNWMKLKTISNPNFYYDVIDDLAVGEDYTFDFNVPNGNEYVANGIVSHNSGEGLRGTRANCVCVDEGLLITREIQQFVIRPFLTNKSLQQVQDEKRIREAEDELVQAGTIKEDDRTSFPRNKYFVFSSASYEFEYLYELFLQTIEAIEKHSGLKSDPSYFAIRASYEAIPENTFMDYTQINTAKAGGGEHTEYFRREYRGLFTSSSDGYFNVKKMHECTVEANREPTLQIKGELNAKYILAIDPSYSASKASDFFAMGVYQLNEQENTITLVHTYGRAGGNLKDHYNYLVYILSYFNCVFITIDASGTEFIDGFNESSIAAERSLTLGFLDANFDEPDTIKLLEEIRRAKNQYNLSSRRIVYARKFTSESIRRMNEHLQNQIDAKKVWFGSPILANEDVSKRYLSMQLPFSFKNKNDTNLELLEFLEEQDAWVQETKAQITLIQVKSTSLGSLQYDIPQNLRRETGINRPRKDNYTCMLLGCWSNKVYRDIMYTATESAATTFTPIMIR